MDEPYIGPINVGDIENKIIEELFKGRKDISELAKNIDTSKLAVSFILNKLENSGIVEGKDKIIIPATPTTIGLSRKTYGLTRAEQKFYKSVYG